jgi:hypothetical protein
VVLLFAGFSAMSALDGDWRDAKEAGVPRLLLAAAVFSTRRWVRQTRATQTEMRVREEIGRDIEKAVQRKSN